MLDYKVNSINVFGQSLLTAVKESGIKQVSFELELLAWAGKGVYNLRSLVPTTIK